MIQSATSQQAPTLSVIVPAYNASEQLRQCLESLSASTYAHFDVLVVDDGSTTPVKPIVNGYGYRSMRTDDRGGPARARNIGARNVHGSHLVFVDADVCVHPDTLAVIAEIFQSHNGLAAVVGTYDEHPRHPGFLSQYKNLFHRYVHRRSAGTIATFWAGCGAMRRDVFLEFGGFDADQYRRPAIEDIELGTRLARCGHQIILDERVQATHLKRWSFWNLLRTDVFARGIPWVQLMRRVGGMENSLNVRWSQRISVVLSYLTLVALAWSIRQPLHLISTALIVLIIIIINSKLYRFFWNCRGLWFTLRGIPMHLLYLLYCGFCVVVGTIRSYTDADPPSRPGPTMSTDTIAPGS